MELVINFSGGKDSTAMLALLCELYPHSPKHVVMADTGWEHVDRPGQWPSAIDWSRGIAAMFGLDLHVVRNPNKTFLQMVERRGKFPAPAQRQCTSDLKRDPVRTWIRRRWPPGEAPPKGVIMNCMGLRADESPGRAKKKIMEFNTALSKSGRHVEDYHPIIGWTEDEVMDYLAERDIPIHPAYEHLRRFSCRVCIFMTPADLRAVRQHDPEAFTTIAALEQRIGFTMQNAGTIEERAA